MPLISVSPAEGPKPDHEYHSLLITCPHGAALELISYNDGSLVFSDIVFTTDHAEFVVDGRMKAFANVCKFDYDLETTNELLDAIYDHMAGIHESAWDRLLDG